MSEEPKATDDRNEEERELLDAREEESSRESELVAPAMGGQGAAPERLLATKEVLEGILRRMGSKARVEVRDTPEAIACRIDPSEDDPIFAGPERAQVVEALQFFANRIVNRDQDDDRKWIVLAVGEEVGEGEAAITAMAHRLADAARRMKRPLTVVGMEARHRRILHLSLADEEGIRTHSKGAGSLRRVVIEAGSEE